MVRSLLRQRLGTTHLKIAAADAAAPPYFHVRWSRRGAGAWGENSHFHRAGVARQGHVGLST
jgi:hypothetical protein